MTALVHRSLIGMAECPDCQAPVYLGTAEPREQLEEIRLEQQPDPVALVMPRWWECVHMGPPPHWNWIGEPHRWETAGPIEIRPVQALHVDVVPRWRRPDGRRLGAQ